MTITDQARNHLFNTLREAFGEEDAVTMMDLLPPTGWADVARQRDLDQLEARMYLRFDSLDQRMAQTNRFIGWMMASNAALIAAVTLIVSLVTTLR
jgi:hypothetical protein